MKGTCVNYTYKHQHPSLSNLCAMSELGWYKCRDVEAAVDHYDVLGVPPHPGDEKHRPFQRAVLLSMVPSQQITKCYHQAVESAEGNARQLERVQDAYNSLRNKAGRDKYDLVLLQAATKAGYS